MSARPDGKSELKRRSRRGDAFSALIKDILGIYVQLTLSGDELAADFGLTSARWQVIGAIREANKSVSEIARERGLARQSVQRIVNALHKQKYIRFVINPKHQRAKHVELTAAGRKALEGVAVRQSRWANELGSAFALDDLEKAAAVTNRLRSLLVRPINTKIDHI